MTLATDTPDDRILARVAELQQLDVIQQLPQAELQLLAQLAVLRAFEPRAVIVAEQTVARNAFVVLTGNVEQSMRDTDDVDVTLALLGRGDVFGEGGLFGLRYRRTTVRATTRSFLLQFKYADLQQYVQQLPEFFNLLRIQFRQRLLQTTLARVSLLATLNPFERLSLTQELDDRRVERGAVIMAAGGISEGLYIVAEGQAIVEHEGRTIAVLEPGDVFGEMSLLDNAPHEASIVALTPVHLLLLPRSTFEYALTQRPDIAEGLEHLAAQRRRTDRTDHHAAITKQLIKTGIVRGRRALVREQALCDPGCRRCEEACAERFTVARLNFSSEPLGALEPANVCRHCQWGAECVEACPEDAFRLDPSGHLIITDRCTGCGACVSACPYDAISEVPIYPSSSNPFAWLMQRFSKQQPTMMRANKCDACHGYDDHACISACPTGALRWVPTETLYHPHKPIETIALMPV